MVGRVTEPLAAAAHRALADPSRLALLRLLDGADDPLDAHALAAAVGLHVNTVRWHLKVLIDAGLVSEARLVPGARGRPRHGYRMVPGALDGYPGGFRLLADVLAETLERGGNAETIEAVGRERGRALATTLDVPPSPQQAVRAVLQLFERFGFRPQLRRARAGRRIDMRPCPFGEIAVKHASVVCPLHLALMRGVLEAFGADAEATALEPFARPDRCVAHLGRS